MNISCVNLAKGHFELITGKYTINQSLINVIRVLANEKDLTGQVMCLEEEYMHDFNTISFVDMNTPFMDTTKSHAEIYFATGEIYVAPDVIAKVIADMWVNGRHYNTNYGVNGTVSLLQAILHEITHSRVHKHFYKQDGETAAKVVTMEENHVQKYTRAQSIAFMKKYALTFDTMEFMHRLITEELAKTDVGRLIIEKQSSWFKEHITSVDRHGTQVLSLRAEFRKQYEPFASWPAQTTTIEEEIQELDAEVLDAAKWEAINAQKIEEQARVIAATLNVPPPPPAQVAKRVPPPPPPMPTAKVPPPPPRTVVAPPPPPPPSSTVTGDYMYDEVPIGAYEDCVYMVDEAALIAAAAAEEPASKSIVMEAIKRSTTYAPQPILPTRGSATMEAVAQKVGYAIFCHIFEQCGWVAGKDEWSTPEGREKAPIGFTNPEAVTKDIDLSKIPGARDYVEFFYVSNAEGNRQVTQPFSTHIRGYMSSKIKLPMFKVGFKDGDTRIIRTYSAQNVWAVKADKITPTDGAVRAREKGSPIMWINEENLSDEAIKEARANKQRATKFVGFFEDYNYIPTNKQR